MARRITGMEWKKSAKFYCFGCKQEWDGYHSAERDAKAHTRVTGHKTRVVTVTEVKYAEIVPYTRKS